MTGASSGIGLAAARAFSAAGDKVLGIDLTSPTAEEHGDIEFVTADVTDETSLAEALLGRSIDVVVNCAGIIVRKGIEDTTLAEWNRVIGVNMTGSFLVIKAALPALKSSQHSPSIVQVASISGHIAYGYPAYTASKGAVLALTRELATELAPLGIRVNSISPGVTRTGINTDTLSVGEISEATLDATPLGRLGAPEDMAEAIRFIAGPGASFITGQDLVVDGGMSSHINWGGAGDALRNAHS